MICSEADRNYRVGTTRSVVPSPPRIDPYQARVDEIRAATVFGVRMRRIGKDAKADAAFNHARRLIQSALTELTPRATELDVWLAVEPMHPGCAAEWTFLTGIDDVLAGAETKSAKEVETWVKEEMGKEVYPVNVLNATGTWREVYHKIVRLVIGAQKQVRVIIYTEE